MYLTVRLIPVYPTINLQKANCTKLDYMGQVITDSMLWGQKSEKVGFIVTKIEGLFVIGMNISQTYAVISITGLGKGINVRSRVSNGIIIVSMYNDEIVKVYIWCKNRIFKDSIKKITY